MKVIRSIASDPLLNALERRIAPAGTGTRRRPPPAEGLIHVSGLWGSSAPLVAAFVAARCRRPVLYLTAHLEDADRARDDIELFLGRACEVFPAWESLPGEGTASGEIEAERHRVCTLLNQVGAAGPAGSEPAPAPVVVAPVLALMQPVPAPAELLRNTLSVRTGEVSEGPAGVSGPEFVLGWAVDRGFARLDLVESPGDVAQRGDIVDIYPFGETAPVRIQFDGDAVESIRRFDISAQRSVESLDSLAITALPVAGDGDEGRAEGNTRTGRGKRRGETRSGRGTSSTPVAADFLTYLPADALILVDGPAEVQTLGETLASRMGNTDALLDVSTVFQRCAAWTQLHLGRFAADADEETVLDFAVGSVSRFEARAGEAIDELCRLAHDHEVHVFCDNEGERRRLSEMLAEKAAGSRRPIELHIGVLHQGFVWTRTQTAVISHHEIFHRQRQRWRLRRVEAGRPIESWTDLQPGDHVVHVVHGIAVYRGMGKMRKGDSAQFEEFLTLEFADGGVVHVPCSQIDLVQKYIGAGGRKPKLSTLGGRRWSRTKERVAEAVSDLAESLLRIQAARARSAGTPYPTDTEWQREFEAAFPYEETDDQLTVATEIRSDLCRARPMDRLICGDVGYGKTELAMRAAFKVVEYGRQVAVLVPTTVLAEQHYESFRQRMAEYPFSIASLSRFRSPAEQKVIVEKVRRGQIDIVIGTHRLLSKDVRFANLGLVIIDEEQRFGVENKERLRAMRETVDVLTLTATPIPRTLHMSLMGIRDISSLQTPPVDRRSIATSVRPFSRDLIREAVLRELNRDGQVFFVHNYVQSIAAMADTVRSIVPEARVLYGHGQMNEHQLEAVMRRFYHREADVLVCTTIIESGIDIPTVNTIFINRAERFGLADLHQLRGRVGRSSHKAYCYLLLSPDRPPAGNAAKRLKTIEEFSELGAGFRIAMRDLEIRGAGNLLGREQSGHIAAVGYEMYCRLVEQTVRRLKNEPDPSPPPVHVDLDVAAHVPSHYAASERARIEIYRRVAACRTPEDLAQMERDLVDAFGPIPQELGRLLEVAEIRVLARSFGIASIRLQRPDVIFAIDRLPLAEPLFENAPGSVRLPDPKTVHVRLPPAYLEPSTLLPVLRRMFKNAAERMEAGT